MNDYSLRRSFCLWHSDHRNKQQGPVLPLRSHDSVRPALRHIAAALKASCSESTTQWCGARMTTLPHVLAQHRLHEP